MGAKTNPKMVAVLIAFLVSAALIILIWTGSQPGDNSLEGGSGELLTGKVTKIVDGDTLYVEGIKIRLALVDTPEYYEEGYEEAKQFTSSLCSLGSYATVDQDDKQPYDPYGRTLAVVYCGGKNLNKELLENGYAKILTKYCDDSEFQNQAWAKEYGC